MRNNILLIAVVIFILGLVAWMLILSSPPPVRSEPYASTAPPNYYEIHTGGNSPTLQSVVNGAASGSLVKFYPGTYTIDKVSIPASKTLYFQADKAESVILSGTDTLITTASDLYLENLTITATGPANSLVTTSSAEYHFKGCVLNLLFQDFKDSVWAENTKFNCTAADLDSMRFSEYADLYKSSQRGVGWSFGVGTNDSVTAILRECDGYATATANLHMRAASQKVSVSIFGGSYQTTAAKSSIKAVSEAFVEAYGASLYNAGTGSGGATFYAIDSTKVFLSGVQFYNRARGTNNNLWVQSSDTIDVSACTGNAICKLDSSNVANLSKPIVYWSDANLFAGASFGFGATLINTNVKVAGTALSNIKLSGVAYYLSLNSPANQASPFDILNSGGSHMAYFDFNGQLVLKNDLYMMGTGSDIKFDWDKSGNKPAMSMGMFNNAGDSTVIVQVDSVYYLEGVTPNAR